ncbi:conserved hypothetical protein, partial [Ricinus communis]
DLGIAPVLGHDHRLAQPRVEREVVVVAAEREDGFAIGAPGGQVPRQFARVAMRAHRQRDHDGDTRQRAQQQRGDRGAAHHPRGRQQALPADRRQRRDRRHRRQDVADQLGLRQREERHHDGQPGQQQRDQAMRIRAVLGGGLGPRGEGRAGAAGGQDADAALIAVFIADVGASELTRARAATPCPAPAQRQPGQRREVEDQQHRREEPEGLHVVEAGAREALQVLHDEEEVQELRMPLLHQRIPGRGHGQHGGDTGQPEQRQDVAPAAQRQQPHDDDQPRQHDADQPLGQDTHARRGVGRQQRGAPGQADAAAQQRVDGQRQRRGDAARDQHVEVGVLRAQEEHGQRQQHRQRDARDRGPGPAVQQQVEADRGQPAAQHRRGAAGQLVHAEERHRDLGDPVEQRGLVEEGLAVEQRLQPLAAADRLPGDADVAALVGQLQRAQTGAPGQPDQRAQQREQHLPARQARR